eukprot:Rhum_TRINITY_DN3645_c0_g1::Rhum_TRINITY_DN3645_c0_g1_i1::g.11553::m.11553
MAQSLRRSTVTASRRAASAVAVVPPPAVLTTNTAPAFADFNGRQTDALWGMGALKLPPGANRDVGLFTKPVEAAPQTLSEAPARRLASHYKEWMDLPARPLEVSEFVEEMLELHSEHESPARTLLRVLQSFPYLDVRGDAAALFILKYHELAEEAARAGKHLNLWSSKVYPLFVFLTLDLRRGKLGDVGLQAMRAMELFLDGAVARGEVTANYAGYFMQNIKETQLACNAVRKLDYMLSQGDFTGVLQHHLRNEELDLRLYTLLMQGLPDFFDSFPRKLPQARDDFLAEMRQVDAMYVLHPSYVTMRDESPHADPDQTAASRLSNLLSLVNSDDEDAETMLVPYWTVHAILVHCLDTETEDVSEVMQLLAKAFSAENTKVRFVWPSELITPLVSYKSLMTSLGNSDDKIVTFAKWLDALVPPLDEHAIRESDEAVANAEADLMRAKLFGYKKEKVDEVLYGNTYQKSLYPILRKKSDQLNERVQHGTIVLARDPQVHGHCKSLQVWCEPVKGRRSHDFFTEDLKTTWFKFHSPRQRTRERLRDKRLRKIVRKRPSLAALLKNSEKNKRKRPQTSSSSSRPRTPTRPRGEQQRIVLKHKGRPLIRRKRGKAAHEPALELAAHWTPPVGGLSVNGLGNAGNPEATSM